MQKPVCDPICTILIRRLHKALGDLKGAFIAENVSSYASFRKVQPYLYDVVFKEFWIELSCRFQ